MIAEQYQTFALLEQNDTGAYRLIKRSYRHNWIIAWSFVGSNYGWNERIASKNKGRQCGNFTTTKHGAHRSLLITSAPIVPSSNLVRRTILVNRKCD